MTTDFTAKTPHSETRAALWNGVTRLRCHAQELDREVEHLEAQISQKKAAAAEERRLANHITSAAEILGKVDTETD